MLDQLFFLVLFLCGMMFLFFCVYSLFQFQIHEKNPQILINAFYQRRGNSCSWDLRIDCLFDVIVALSCL